MIYLNIFIDMKYLKRKIKLFFAYIVALVFAAFLLFPFYLFRWIFSLFKKIDYEKHIKYVYYVSVYYVSVYYVSLVVSIYLIISSIYNIIKE